MDCQSERCKGEDKVAKRQQRPQSNGATLTVPVAEPLGEGYQTQPVSDVAIRHLTPRQRIALRRLFGGLQTSGADCGGRPIETQADALRWVLERVAERGDV